MFLGLGQGRDRDSNFSTCWDLLQIGFKFYFLLQIILSLLSYFLADIFKYFPNILSFTVQKFQLWRLLSSILLPSTGSFAIVNVLFNFYLLYMFMPDFEKKLSTMYILLQVLLQTFLSNIVLTVVGYPFIYYLILEDQSLVGFGILPVLFYFLWAKVANNPQQPTRFCFFPCLIPMKYIPLCLLALYMVFKYPPFPLLVYCLLGFYQIIIRKKAILRLPLSVYRKVEAWMPVYIKEKLGFIKISAVEAELKKVCLGRGCCDWGSQDIVSNPIQNESSSVGGHKERVEVIGNAVAIGGTEFMNSKNQKDFKKYWKNKEQKEVVEDTLKNVGNVNQNQICLQSDENFNPDLQHNNLGSSSNALKRCDQSEVEKKSEASEIGLRSDQHYENDGK